MHNLYLPLALLTCLALPTVTAAENQNPIVVTATRTAQTVDETLASVTVIDRETIVASQARDAAELLQRYAGVDIARNGGPGQSTSIFLRGSESNHTLVLIDGVKINPGTIGQPALQNIDPAIIERIEVVRGPRSTLYGSEALGGVIQIFTRRGAAKGHKAVGLSAGTDNARGASASLHLPATKQWQFGADLAWQQTDGFATKTSASEDRGYDNLSLSTYVRRELAQGSVSLQHWQAGGNTEYFDFFDTTLDQDFKNQTTALRWQSEVSEQLSLTAQLSYGRDEIKQQQANYLLTYDFVDTDRYTLDLQADVVAGDAQLFTLGTSFTQEETGAVSFGESYAENRDIAAVFIQDQIELGSHQWLLGARYTDHDTQENMTNWELSYGYRWSPMTRFYATAGTAFRVPDSTDRFGFGGNPDLKTEESFNREIGIAQRFSAQHSLQASFYYNDIDNLIAYDNVAFQLLNTDAARIRGLELMHRYELGKLELSSTLILQDPKDKGSGQQLPRRSRKSIALNAQYDFGRFNAGMQFYASGPRPDSAFSDTNNAGYGLFNLTASTALSRELRLDLKLENALDKQYALADGFNTQDRAWFISLHYQPE